MEPKIDARKLYQIKNSKFYKSCRLSWKQQKKIAKHVVSYLRGHFHNWVNPIVVRDFGAGISLKFKFGGLSKESVSNFEKYFEEVEAMNVWKVFDKAIGEAVLWLKGKHPVDDRVVEDVMQRATEWFKKELI